MASDAAELFLGYEKSGAICRKYVLTGQVRPVPTSGTLCSEPEHPLDETDLPNDIALCQPTHLPLADHVHRLIPLDRSQRTVDRSEPLAGCQALL